MGGPAFRSILAGTDGSPRAEEAARQAVRPPGGGAPAAGAGVQPPARGGGGEPAAALVEEARERGADLLCVGPDAGILGGAIRIGQVAAHVVREAPCSVLLAREAGPDFPRRVACGVDGSSGSVETAMLAAQVAAATGAELRLLHVIPVFRGDNAEWTLDPEEPSPPELEPSVR